MKKQSQRIALCGMLTALSLVLMTLGGAIPAATFCSPALAGLLLLPIFDECGKKYAYAAWLATALLSLMLCPDKESAMLYLFLGYYPVLKDRIDTIRSIPLRTLVKLFLFNTACGAMLFTLVQLLGMRYILTEYTEMSRIGLIIFIIVCNFTLIVYDRMLAVMMWLYRKALRPRLFKH